MLLPLLVFAVSLAIIVLSRPGSPRVISELGTERGMYLDRPAGAVLGGLGMVLCGAVSTEEALHQAINYDTLILLFSMMVICAYLVEARVFRFVSYVTLTRIRSARALLVATVFVSGLLSAVLVNDTVCLMTTPLVVQCCRDARIKPLPYLLAICFGANAGSVATPTGNPQNMIIGTLSGIPYTTFVRGLGVPALVSMVLVALCLLWLFRDQLPKGTRLLPQAQLQRPAFDPFLATLALLVLLGVVGAFCLGQSMAWSAAAGAGVLMLLGRRTPRRLLAEVDYVLLVFFGGLFVLVYGVGKVGLAQALFVRLQPLLGNSVMQQATVFGAFTVVVSQVVSNVPFVLLASQWMKLFLDPTFVWLSMALVSTLAGNLTIVGSVANIIVLDSAGPDGRIGFLRFLRYGFVVTAVTCSCSLLILWLERALGLL